MLHDGRIHVELEVRFHIGMDCLLLPVMPLLPAAAERSNLADLSAILSNQVIIASRARRRHE